MSNVDIFRQILSSRGWSPTQVAGILGRLQQESGPKIDTSIVGDSGMSVGGAQWNGARLQGLKSFARDMGMDFTDPRAQAMYIDHELNTTERRAGNMLRNASTLEDAARAAMAYERPRGFTWGDPTAGHGWTNTLRNAQRLASMGATPSIPGGTGTAAAATTPAVPGVTLNTVPPAVTPTATAAVDAPEPSVLDTFQDKGFKAGMKQALGDNNIMGGLSGLAGLFGGGGQTAAAPQPAPVADDGQQAAIAQGASQIMAQLLAKKRTTPGLSLMGVG